MPRIIHLQEQPSPAATYARVATTLIKKGASFLPDLELVVDSNQVAPDKLKLYNKVCGFPDSRYVPATYLQANLLTLQTHLLSAPEMPFPLLGMVHLANSFKQFRPLEAGENFQVICKTGNLVAHNKGQAFEIRSYIEVHGKRVLEATSVYLCKLKTEGVGSILEWRQPELPANSIKSSWHLDSNLGFQYAQASGDFNPIHLHPLSAKLFGFNRHIIHGMWTLAKVLSSLQNQLSDAYELTAAFKTPVYLPNDIIFRHIKTDNGFDFDVVDKTQEQPHVKGYLVDLRK
jgi:hypothetical protein